MFESKVTKKCRHIQRVRSSRESNPRHQAVCMYARTLRCIKVQNKKLFSRDNHVGDLSPLGQTSISPIFIQASPRKLFALSALHPSYPSKISRNRRSKEMGYFPAGA
ncbi:hypothetical protein H2248_007191 [Termitomyces sp. 'cryptogamus']|nr:hypothetical protein H2248_007191 [Termitomyces sp. 'cryptogamus']